MNKHETERTEYLHRAFTEIATRVAAGEEVVRLLRAFARRRSRHLPRGKYSTGAVRTLYYKWKKAPSPLALVRNYRGAPRRVPKALLVEYINRIMQSDVVSAYAAFDSLLVDWRRGVPIPGIQSWLQSESGARWAPRFPFSRTTLYDHLSGGRGRRFQRLAGAAVQGQRAVRRLEAFLEERRSAFSEASKHERIA